MSKRDPCPGDWVPGTLRKQWTCPDCEADRPEDCELVLREQQAEDHRIDGRRSAKR